MKSSNGTQTYVGHADQERNGVSWKEKAEKQEGQEEALPGLSDVENTAGVMEEVEAEVAGKELGLGDILVSGTSGLLTGPEVLLDVAGVVFCVLSSCCASVGDLWVTEERKAQAD